MFQKLRGKNASNSLGECFSPSGSSENGPDKKPSLPDRLPYSRPEFLRLVGDLAEVSDHSTRSILTAGPEELAWGAGYAECINGGKSRYNEDQAASRCFPLLCSDGAPPLVDSTASQEENQVETVSAENLREALMRRKSKQVDVAYFAIFDGHAGTGASLTSAKYLICHLQEKLVEIQSSIVETHEKSSRKMSSFSKTISKDSLITGALEAAFEEMDEQILREKGSFNITGGCTALVSLFILGKLYVANAGDCRAVLYQEGEIIPMSREFTPDRELQRLQMLAHNQPELLHNEFTYFYFSRHVTRRDIGKRVLCKGPFNNGWVYKEVTEDDLKHCIVHGEGKWARLLGTIGVTRGFGDHNLTVFDTPIHIKPFLLSFPEVRIFDLTSREVTQEDYLVMGSDGLWDMLSNEIIQNTVKEALEQAGGDNPARFEVAAKALVHKARGDLKGNTWKLPDGGDASYDDITAFVIPVHPAALQRIVEVPV